MHEVIRDRLEEYLRNRGQRAVPNEFESHLKSCAACAQDLREMESQSRLLGALRGTPEVEASGGFYARVMQRIEERRNAESFWSPLTDRAFGKRLAYAFAALVLVLGTYLMSSEPPERDLPPSGLVVADTAPSSSVDEQVPPQQRDAVLVNLASYPE